MSGTRPAEILRQLQHTGVDSADSGSDKNLLDRFSRSRDQAAFAALVQRHGPMVLAVCRRVTAHPQDAEDAFQAVFLVLARKAGTILTPGLLGNWLYGVAVRVSQRARRSATRRRGWEVQVVDMPDPPAPAPSPHTDLGPVIHEELAALPAHYREAIVLCDLRGASRADAAKALGIPEGTLSSRLAGGRKRLAGRLARRGVTLSAAAVPAALADGRAWSAVTDQLVSNTCGLVATWAAGGAVPGSILRLAQGRFPVGKTLLLTTLSLALAMGGVVLATRAGDPPETAPIPRLSESGLALVTAPQPPNQPGGPVAPRLRITLDLPIPSVEPEQAVWSADGKSLAIRGVKWTAGADNGPQKFDSNRVVVVADVFGPAPRIYRIELPEIGRLVGFTPDGSQVVTDLREYQLLSGLHRLHFWSVPPPQPAGSPPGSETLLLSRTTNLDAVRMYGNAFRPDGKSFLTVTVVPEYRAGASTKVLTRVAVREVDAASGATLHTALTVPGEYGAVALSRSGDRFAAVDLATAQITVWDVARREKISAFDYPAAVPPRFGTDGTTLLFSPDAKRLLCLRERSPMVVLDADKGQSLPTPEGAEHFWGAGGLTADGRSLILAGTHRVVVEPPFRRKDGVLEPIPGEFGQGPDGFGQGPGGFGQGPGGFGQQLGGKGGQLGGKGGRMNPNPVPRRAYQYQSYLGIWEVATGKQIRGWNRIVHVAVHPTRPVVAILEENDEGGVRLGLWDLASETTAKN